MYSYGLCSYGSQPNIYIDSTPDVAGTVSEGATLAGRGVIVCTLSNGFVRRRPLVVERATQRFHQLASLHQRGVLAEGVLLDAGTRGHLVHRLDFPISFRDASLIGKDSYGLSSYGLYSYGSPDWTRRRR